MIFAGCIGRQSDETPGADPDALYAICVPGCRGSRSGCRRAVSQLPDVATVSYHPGCVWALLGDWCRSESVSGSSILVQHEGLVAEMRASDGYVNATKMCKSGRKQWSHYYRLAPGQQVHDQHLASCVLLWPG